MKKIIFAFFLLLLTGCEKNTPLVQKDLTAKRPTHTLEKTLYEPTLSLTGTVDAEKEIFISSKISGRIQNVLVQEGDVVYAQQKILEYSPENDQTQTDYQNAQRQIDLVSQNVENNVLSAQTALQNAQSEAQNIKNLSDLKIQTSQRALETQTQHAETILHQVTNFLNSFLKITAPFKSNDQSFSEFIGKNDVLEKQKIRNQTEEFLNYANTQTPQDTLLSGEKKLFLLEQLQEIFTRFDLLAKKSPPLGDFTRDQKRSLEKEITQLLQNLNQNIREMENAVQNYKSALREGELQNTSAQNRIRQAEKTLENVLSQGATQKQSALYQLEQTQNLQKELTLYSPFSGIITEKIAEEGELVSPGQPVLKLADTQTFTVEVFVPDTFLSQVKRGNSAQIKIDGQEKSYPGEVTQIYPSVDPVTRKVKIEIALTQKTETLKIGLFARVDLSLNPRESFFVPPSFIQHSFEGPSVVLLSGKRILVQRGNKKENLQEIRSPDLKEGDILILP